MVKAQEAQYQRVNKGTLCNETCTSSITSSTKSLSCCTCLCNTALHILIHPLKKCLNQSNNGHFLVLRDRSEIQGNTYFQLHKWVQNKLICSNIGYFWQFNVALCLEMCYNFSHEMWDPIEAKNDLKCRLVL